MLFDVLYDGIKDNKENYARVWIPLENSLLEMKHISLPVWCDHLALKLGVQVHDVVDDVLGDVVVGQDNRDKFMTDTPKSISKIKPSHMNSFLV